MSRLTQSDHPIKSEFKYMISQGLSYSVDKSHEQKITLLPHLLAIDHIYKNDVI